MVSEIKEPSASLPGSRYRVPRASATLAFVGLVTVHLVVKLGGFPRLHQIVRRWPVSKKTNNDHETIATVCAAVERAISYHLKHTWCLERSAVLTCYLRAKGVPAEMVIGCRKMPFHGHAWVEVDGQVVNDNQKVLTFYEPLYRC